MSDYLFDIGDIVYYYSYVVAKITGPVLARESYSHGNFYYIGTGDPWLQEILISEEKLRNANAE